MSLKFTGNTKSTLDVVIPVTGAGIVFYYLFKNKKADLEKTAISAAIVLVVLYIITTQLTKRILASVSKPPDIVVTPDLSGTVDNNSTGTNGSFDATGWAKRLYDDISPFNWLSMGHDYQLYDDMALLSNASLILIYNAWQATYYAQYDNRTLVKAMKDESYPNAIDGTNDKVQTILNRYASLGAA